MPGPTPAAAEPSEAPAFQGTHVAHSSSLLGGMGLNITTALGNGALLPLLPKLKFWGCSHPHLQSSPQRLVNRQCAANRPAPPTAATEPALAVGPALHTLPMLAMPRQTPAGARESPQGPPELPWAPYLSSCQPLHHGVRSASHSLNVA